MASSYSPGGPRFLTAVEAAERMRISKMTVYRLIKAGKLPAVRIGRSYRVREEDLDRYLESSYVTAAGSSA
ncbi:MAG: helix-turn-helix domain-containing protein [Acidobacteria bacterium]|nr:helix-turn-helix domain-containing protein [Acidobacteriota bacterium]